MSIVVRQNIYHSKKDRIEILHELLGNIEDPLVIQKIKNCEEKGLLRMMNIESVEEEYTKIMGEADDYNLDTEEREYCKKILLGEGKDNILDMNIKKLKECILYLNIKLNPSSIQDELNPYYERNDR